MGKRPRPLAGWTGAAAAYGPAGTGGKVGIRFAIVRQILPFSPVQSGALPCSVYGDAANPCPFPPPNPRPATFAVVVVKSPVSKCRGHTLAEMLLAGALLMVILTFTVHVLNHARHSQASARVAADLSTARDQVLTAVERAAGAMVFTRHPAFRAGSASLEWVSGQHFVSGPAARLLPETSGLCGDALFFQRRNQDGELEATGFLVQYSDGRAWQPPGLPNLKPQWRFRLLQFQQPAGELQLRLDPGLASGIDTASGLPFSASRQWFALPLKKPAPPACRVVADHVIAMLIETVPAAPGGWDSQQPPPDHETAPDQLRDHRLPNQLVIHFLLVTGTGWDRLDEAEARSLARELQLTANTDRAHTGLSVRQILNRLRELCAPQSIRTEILTLP